jgi:hypothetical protein
LQLTGSPSEEDLHRVSLARFSNVVTIGNRKLMYKIASTPGFNVGRFEYAAQYDFLSKHTTLLESATTASASSTSYIAAGSMILEEGYSGSYGNVQREGRGRSETRHPRKTSKRKIAVKVVRSLHQSENSASR